MRGFNTVVLERLRTFESDFETEPYETAWATEAMFFLRVHEISGAGAALEARVQVSVDGIEWIDEGTAFPSIREAGNSFVKVSHFGGWLRLACSVSGNGTRLKLTIALALKE
jgi:hypothetical protein